MFDARQFATNFMNQNRNLPNNPLVQQYASLIQSGDAKRGEEVANNILKSYGITKEEGMQMAKQFFHIPG